MKLKKIITFIVTMLMFFSVFQVGTLPVYAADQNDTVLTVETTSGFPGSEVSLDISIANNPGLLGMTLYLEYDEDILTLTEIENGSALGGMTFTTPKDLHSGINLPWDAEWVDADINVDGIIATLKFTVSEEAESDDFADITLSYDPGAIIDDDMNPVNPKIVQGGVNVQDFIWGDTNSDLLVNTTDVVALRRYIAGGYGISINEKAGDVNVDTMLNTTDVVLIRRFIAGGYGITFPYGQNQPQECKHSMTHVAAKAATETVDGNREYWYCSKCNKYFTDADGKNSIAFEDTIIKAEGTGERYTVTYNIANGDDYLAYLSVDNSNPGYYVPSEGLTLKNLSVPGYNFLGWYDLPSGSNAEIFKKIPVGTTGDIELYAHWEKIQYTITFDNSSMSLPSSTKTYTVDQRVTLDKPTIDRYVFLGWTTDKDELVSEIKPGTTGNIKLSSNWTSKRNLARPVAKLGDPIIVEDTNEGRLLFTYEIGQVENVPLYTIKELPSAGGVVSVYTETVTKGMSKTEATNVAESIDHITTDSTAWTLSEDWNETTHVEDSVLNEHGYDRTTGKNIAKTSSNTYTLTTNDYDNTVVKSNEGTVATTTQYDTNEVNQRETWESKASLSVSDTESAKYTSSAEVSAEVGAKGFGVEAKVGASMSSSSEISSTTTAGASTEATIAHENTSHSKTGTDKVTVEDNTTTTTTDKGWSKTENSSSSSSSSLTQYEEEVLSELIAKEHTYGQSYAKGGSNSTSADSTISTGKSSLYSTTLTYFTSEETTEGVQYTIGGESDGNYRLVRAGIVHVFGVVIYDIASAEYSVTTYGVLDDDTYTYIDYSATGAAKFDDNENGVLPFEIPYFVNDYVNGRVLSTEGLEYDVNTLSCDVYEGTETSVVIPEFISVDNVDGTYSAYTIRNLAAGTFSGNADIKSVLLSNFIREIPASAFAGCTSLQFVYGSEISSIGANAFDGCTSLGEFKVSSTVESIGTDAFKNVDSIVVDASCKEVVTGAINSGAKRITINVSNISDELNGVTLEIPDTVEYFELQGGRNTFSGLKIKSDAGETVLNGINITDSTGIPLEISSEKVTLNQVNVESPSYVLLLKGEEPTVSLYGASSFVSGSENAVVCRNTTFEKINSNLTTKLEITGNLLAYNEPTDELLLISFPEFGEIVSLTEEEYDQYIRGCLFVNFNANGGTVGTESMVAYIGTKVGTLPTPKRDYYTFNGWYTAASSGEKVTADTVFNSGEDVTLYAHWTQNELSGWVTTSNVPSGAQVVNTKWEYDLTSYTTSSSSSLSGWTKYDTKRTSWGTKQGPVYSDPSNGTRNVTSEQYVTSTTTHYKYYHRYGTGTNVSTGETTTVCGTDSSLPRGARHEIDLTYQLDKKSTTGSIQWYGTYNCPVCGTFGRNFWDSDGTYTTNNYGTRWYYQEPVYTYYYKKTEHKSTTASDPTGQTNVSNVVKYVQYRNK